MAMTMITEYRADGWPLCPQCEEDELYSLLAWNGDGERPPIQAYIAAGLRCYYCGWSNQVELIREQLAAMRRECPTPGAPPERSDE